MKNIIILLALIISTIYGQDFNHINKDRFNKLDCVSNKVIYLDTLGKEIDTSVNNLLFILNNGTDTLKLEKLYDSETTNKLAVSPYGLNKLEEKNGTKSVTETTYNTINYCIRCSKKEIKVIDSIDINKDGRKEIFLYRELNCSANPPAPGPFGIGCQQHSYRQYEVWDIKTKNRIFAIKNRAEVGITITTNDGRKHGYSFDVNLDKKGVFILSNLSGNESDLEMGNYYYNQKRGEYLKENSKTGSSLE